MTTTTETRTNEYLRSRMANKLVNRELAFEAGNHPRSRKDIVALDVAADTTADVVIAVFDLPLTPYGLREAVRTHIKCNGPRPSDASPAAHDHWYAVVRDEVAVTLGGG